MFVITHFVLVFLFTCFVAWFCQVEDEIKGCLNYLKCVYGILGFNYELNLSTRPEDHMGDIAVWDKAEEVRHFVLTKVVLMKCAVLRVLC